LIAGVGTDRQAAGMTSGKGCQDRRRRVDTAVVDGYQLDVRPASAQGLEVPMHAKQGVF
jgi:hypothetical protein